ncbi:alpha-ketoglutarate-dependent dioxygenase AlkB [Pseudoalteromonas sp. TB64]|uniref:alpha-ketoglutarate-dependent dioxygenase AlkB n=1 Tax=Pseudoalteromonas sp. TB64 TaxID=1938600 RepID=UPI0004065A52|nr:alpha-ketoglutarate-dependent dioxygenase AlkB [Pseudoalteromonas sp. TB64]
MEKNEFYKIILPLEKNIFFELFNSVDFITTGTGRLGNTLVLVGDRGVPIVRTTTSYNVPAHSFSFYQHYLMDFIDRNTVALKLKNSISFDFNNALIEVYDSNYRTMKFHSDQSLDLDLDKDSFIAIFSCYENPEKLSDKTTRKLIVKNKETNEECKITLGHNSVVLFSLETNSRFLHKIILENNSTKNSEELDNRWLGITFRRSKTYINFEDGKPYFPNGSLLELADEQQKKDFFKLKGEENKDKNFIYPSLNYTFSASDTLVPKNMNKKNY